MDTYKKTNVNYLVKGFGLDVRDKVIAVPNEVYKTKLLLKSALDYGNRHSVA